MTKTLALDARQWRVLLCDRLDVLKANVQSAEGITEQGLQSFVDQVETVRMLATAWCQVSPRQEPAYLDEPKAVQSSDPEMPKRRRGRPPKAVNGRAVQ